MNQYAYIPLSEAGNLPEPEAYPVRLAVHVCGFDPCMQDTNGNGIPNILELEGVPFTEAQQEDIEDLGGEWFENAEAYLAWKASLPELAEQREREAIKSLDERYKQIMRDQDDAIDPVESEDAESLNPNH
jgi:hypothetical protein